MAELAPPSPALPPPVPPPPPAAPGSRDALPTPVDAPTQVVITRAPRAGELSRGWTIAMAFVWLGAATAMAAVWKTSDQLGLATWWIGPRGNPNPLPLQVLPFVPPLAMFLAVVNRLRRVAWLGLLASLLIAAVGVVDLGKVARLGAIEIAIAACTALASLAATSGTYRRVQPGASITE